jgi:hypothetical protein
MISLICGQKHLEVLIPKHFITKPSISTHNDGLDNANWDLILYVTWNRLMNIEYAFVHHAKKVE